MVFSALTPRNHINFSPFTSSQLFHPLFNWKHKALAIGREQRRKIHTLQIIRSVLEKSPSNIGNGGTEPARILLERLFARTQKLEEQMSKDSRLNKNEQFSLNLEALESDLQTALVALRKKEEDIQNAEKLILWGHAELDQAKQELEQRKEEIASAYSKQEKLKEELKKAKNDLVSQAREIEGLKDLVEEQDCKIVSARSTVSLNEDELKKMRNELLKKGEEVARLCSDLESRNQLLKEANEIINSQEVQLQELQTVLRDKEHGWAESIRLRKLEEEKLKVAEANLEKQTVEWLLAQEELKRLAEAASKNLAETKESMRYFKRVRSLLVDVRSELVSSQRSLASTHKKIKEQDDELKKQFDEINELKIVVMSYTTTLQDAQLELETERSKFRVEEAQRKELERKLFAEKELVISLDQELKKERSCREEAILLLQKQLEQKNQKFEETQILVQVKESELVEARLEIQHLKSEQTSFQLIIKEKDSNLLTAQQKLEKLNHQVLELKRLMSTREDQLIQAMEKLKEKEKLVHKIHHELVDTKMKYSEAECVVERIAQLTNQLVLSVKDENNKVSGLFEENIVLPSKELEQNEFRKKKQLAAELEMTKEQLRVKETNIFAAERALEVKEEELKASLSRLNAREKDMEKMKESMREDMDGLKKLYELVQERIGDKSMGELAIEKLELESAQLEVEAATSALSKIADLTQKLVEDTTIAFNVDETGDLSVFLNDEQEERSKVLNMITCFGAVEREVFRLSTLTEQLLKEAGIINTVD